MAGKGSLGGKNALSVVIGGMEHRDNNSNNNIVGDNNIISII